MTIQQLEARKQEALKTMRTLKARRDAEKRAFTDAERKTIRENLATCVEIDKKLEGGSTGRLTQPDNYENMNGIINSKLAPSGRGKLYREMFGGQTLSSGGFSSLNEYLGVIASGRYDERLQQESLTMSGGVSSAGGFSVPEEFAARMLDKSLENEIMRPGCQVEPMTSDTKKISGLDDRTHASGSLFGGFTASWAAELDTATDKDATWRMIQLQAKKLYIFSRASNELVADGMSFEEQLGAAIIGAIGWHLDYACLRGTGAGMPLGVLNDPALITVSKETGQAASTICYENLTKMFARLHPQCVNNSVWVANSTCIPQLLTLTLGVGTAGSQIMTQNASGGYSMLTRPVLFTEKLPALGTKGDILLMDRSQYTIGLRKEVSLEKSIHVGWQNDSSGYRSILRADGQGRWASAFTPRNGDTLSWCVALETR